MKLRATAIILCFVLIFGICPYFSVGYATETFSPSAEGSAYIIFGKDIESQGMSFVDGQKEGNTSPEDVLYNSSVIVEGYEARYYLPQNQMHIRVDEAFAQKGDSEFLFIITYYDYGPEWDTIYMDYNSCDPALSEEMQAEKRLNINKPGGTGVWRTQAYFICDADFTGAIAYDSDIRLSTRKQNAFGMIEMINISRARREGGFVPNMSNDKLNMSKDLGLFDSGLTENKQYEPLSWAEAAQSVVFATGNSQNENLVITDSEQKNSSDPISKRELLRLYWRALGYDGSEVDADNAEQKSIELGLIDETDFIFRLDDIATRSNMASIVVNALTVADRNTGTSILDKLIQAGTITREKIRETNDANLNRALDKTPYHLPSRRMVDVETGRIIKVLVFEAGTAIRTYMTSQMFTDDGKRFIVGNNLTGAIYEYNMETEMIRYLDECSVDKLCNAVLQPGDIMYYVKGMEIWRMDLNTYESEKKADIPYGVSLTVPTVSMDEKYFAGNFMRSAEPDDFFEEDGRTRGHIAARLDLETGEWDYSLQKIFTYPTHMDHQMVNPVYNNLIFFAHEGNAKLLDDRLWIGDFSTGEMVNIYKQAYSEDGQRWEPAGHETWSEDGEEIYFISAWRRLKDRVGRGGIIRIKKDGTEREYINNEYNYNHSFTSPDHSWTVADTYTQSGSRQEVVLIDNRTYEATLLVSKFEYAGTGHPHDAHPVISRDNSHVSWGHAYREADGTMKLGCGWMDISDLTDKEMIGGREAISDEFFKYGYLNTESETQKVIYKGAECFKTPANCSFYLDLNNDILFDGQANKTFRITYLDTGYSPITVRYTSHWVNQTDYTKREDKRLTLPRKNSGRWVTKELTLTDASFLNSGRHRSDFAITGGISDLYIQSIELVK